MKTDQNLQAPLDSARDAGDAPRPYDVAVIGGGLAGLCAALEAARTLADRPHGTDHEGRVILLEQSAEAGGRARTRSREGFAFNLGAHALYQNGAAAQYFRSQGFDLPGGAPEQRAQFFTDCADPQAPAFAIPDALFALRSELSAGERYEFLRLFLGLRRVRTQDYAEKSFSDWLNENCRRPRVRSLLEAFMRLSTYCGDPEAISGDAALGQLQLGGVLYLDSGWQTLVDGLLERARKAGVEIVSGCAAQSVALTPSSANHGDAGGFTIKASSAASHSGTFRARSIVLASPPAVARRLLKAGVRAPENTEQSDSALHALEERLGDMQPVHAAALDLALDDLPLPRNAFALELTNNLYLSVHSHAARLTPWDPETPGAGRLRARRRPASGPALVHSVRYLRPGHETRESQEAFAQLETLLDRMQPGWRDRVAAEQRLPKIAVVQDLPRPERGGLRGRMPLQPLADRPGLCFAGDWVGAEGFLSDAAVASGARAGRAAALAGSCRNLIV